MTDRAYAGVDGCPGGWFYVTLNEKSEWSIGMVPKLHTLKSILLHARLILIDMPIGLQESGSAERGCDRAARKMLGKARASSVFPVPVRPVLQAESYEEAKGLNRRLAGKGISLQTWNIVPKLRELDELMQQDTKTRKFIREAHPEVCFCALNDGCAMRHNKKTPEGRREREMLLYRYFKALPDLLAYAASHYPRKKLGWDDMLDAVVLAVTAKHGHASLTTLPDEPECDAFGLPMEIVYFRA